MLFKYKFHAGGSLSCYKAHLVANSSSQQFGDDFDETFSPVVKPATILMVLKTVYMHQPPGFVDSRYSHHVCLLQRSLYGLKQAPRAWFQRFASYATRVSSSTDLLQYIIASLHSEFDMTLNYFLGIYVLRTSAGLYLSQQKYALELLECAHMINCNLATTLVDTESKLYPAGMLIGLVALPPDVLLLVIVFFWVIIYYISRLSINTLSSNAKAEYHVVADTGWLRKLLRELQSPLFFATLVYSDNVSAIYMSTNLVQHQRTKHIEIDIHFVVAWLLRGMCMFFTSILVISMPIFLPNDCL
ncbi:ribonuclease H-like domain-containing protein [Tanacetum coccineum]